jgi:outer membrane receptor for ferrienterochelin and colicins
MRKVTAYLAAILLGACACIARGGTSAPSTLPSDTDFNEPGLSPGLPSTALPSEDAPELELYKDLPVVVAAGKREQTQRDAAASVSVVTQEDIQLFGYRSLADVLRSQRSFYLNTDGLNWFAGVRGFLRPGEWNARLLVLVDGRPTREIIFDQTHIDEDFVVPMEAVQRVEVIRGPGSALYGSDAVFGVINVVTKDGADVNGAQVKLEGGTDYTARGNVLLGFQAKGGWDVLADLSGYTSEGDNHIQYDGVNDAQHNFGNIINSDYEGVYSGFLKIKKGEFSVTLDSEHRDKDNRDATYLTSFFDPGSMQEARTNLTFKFDHEISSDQQLHAMVYYGDYHYQQSLPNGNPGDTYNTTAYDSWVGEEVDYDWQATTQVHLLAGVNATQALGTHQEDFDTITGIVLNIRQSYNDAGAFFEVEDKFTNWLSVTAGGRVDQIQRLGASVSPRLAAILTPTPADTFKALYGRAFRPPNLYEMFYSSPGANTPNPDLQREVCDTFELVWERQFKDGWRTTLDGYLWDLHHAIDDIAQPDGSLQYQNVGTDVADGLEAEVDKKWQSGATLRVYGSMDHAERDGDGLTHSPQWIVGLSAAIPIINDRTFIAVEPQIVSGMKSDLGQSTQATYITNIVLTSRDVVKGLDLQLGLYNLLGNVARLPRDNQFDQFEPTLRYPYPQLSASATFKF